MMFTLMYHLHNVWKTNLVLINLCNWANGQQAILMCLFQQSVCVLLLGKEFLVLTVQQHLDVLSCQSKLMLQVVIPVHFRMIRVLCMGDHICQIVWTLSQLAISKSIYHLTPVKFQNLKRRKNQRFWYLINCYILSKQLFFGLEASQCSVFLMTAFSLMQGAYEQRWKADSNFQKEQVISFFLFTVNLTAVYCSFCTSQLELSWGSDPIIGVSQQLVKLFFLFFTQRLDLLVSFFSCQYWTLVYRGLDLLVLFSFPAYLWKLETTMFLDYLLGIDISLCLCGYFHLISFFLGRGKTSCSLLILLLNYVNMQ